jgi:hypothetical protein
MISINKRQAYRYNVQFNYSVVGISLESFIKILPVLGAKNALVAKDQREEYLIGQITFVKKMGMKSVIDLILSIIPSLKEHKDSNFKISYSCDEEGNIFKSSKFIYTYPQTIAKSDSFIRAPVSTNDRYGWKSDLDDILTSEETIKDFRHVIHILGNAGANDGKTSYIKHKCMNSKIFDLINPLCDRAEIASSLIRGNKNSYYFANIPRVIKETTDFFLIAEELRDGSLELSLPVKRGIRCSNPAIVVVFSNDLPPLRFLSRDRWKIYKIEYDTSGTSSLKLIS